MRKFLSISVILLTLAAALVFVVSCVITQSDGQGALVFVFSIPIMAAFLVAATILSRRGKNLGRSRNLIRYLPKGLSIFLVIFFVSAFIPGLQKLPEAWMTLTGKTFTWVTGKTPYAFFKERASFPKKLAEKLKDQQEVVFSELGVTFAWDKVCIFGPYTNNEKAMSVTGLTWNIEERSEIGFSDSVNALVFLYQGSVNHVVDLKRGIADFKKLDLCISRDKARFAAETNANGATVLRLLTEAGDQWD